MQVPVEVQSSYFILSLWNLTCGYNGFEVSKYRDKFQDLIVLHNFTEQFIFFIVHSISLNSWYRVHSHIQVNSQRILRTTLSKEDPIKGRPYWELYYISGKYVSDLLRIWINSHAVLWIFKILKYQRSVNFFGHFGFCHHPKSNCLIISKRNLTQLKILTTYYVINMIFFSSQKSKQYSKGFWCFHWIKQSNRILQVKTSQVILIAKTIFQHKMFQHKLQKITKH